MKPLTQTEKDLLKDFTQLKSQTLWGVAIANVCKQSDAELFRELCSNLVSQAEDSPGIMTEILGPELLCKLLNLDHGKFTLVVKSIGLRDHGTRSIPHYHRTASA